jgi:hypothetical protein
VASSSARWFGRTERTQLAQGACAGPPPANLSAPALAPVAPGQCVLVMAGPLLSAEVKAVYTLWLDNLFLRADRSEQVIARAVSMPMLSIYGAARLWVTRAAVQGDSVGGGVLTAFDIQSGASVFAHGPIPPSQQPQRAHILFPFFCDARRAAPIL